MQGANDKKKPGAARGTHGVEVLKRRYQLPVKQADDQEVQHANHVGVVNLPADRAAGM
jgi:hypothetical protein